MPTEKARFLIERLGKEQIADVAYTALWEAELDRIARGESRLGLHGFTRKAVDYASRLVAVARKLAEEGGFNGSGKEPLAKCPLCGSEVVERPKSYSCTNQGCGFVLWKKFLNKAVSKSTAKKLLEGKKVYLKGLKGKSGKPFDAFLSLDSQGKPVLAFTKASCRAGVKGA